MRTISLFRILAASATIVSLPAGMRAQAPAGWSDFKRLFQTYVDSDKVVGASGIVMKAGKETGFWNVMSNVDPVFDDVRNDPRFRAAVARVGIPNQ